MRTAKTTPRHAAEVTLRGAPAVSSATKAAAPSSATSAYGVERWTSWTGRRASRSRSTPPPTPVIAPSRMIAPPGSPAFCVLSAPTTTKSPTTAASRASKVQRNRPATSASNMPAEPASTATTR